MEKRFVRPVEEYANSVKLAMQIINSDFKPDILYSVLRGGAVPSIVVDEILADKGADIKFASVLTRSYGGTKQDPERIVKIGGYTLEPWNIHDEKKIILVEDISDSGYSLGAIIADIMDHNSSVKRDDIKVAVIDYKALMYKEPDTNVRIRRLYNQVFEENGVLRQIYDPKTIVTLPNLYSKPDFWINLFVAETEDENDWLSKPHELVGITNDEIIKNFDKELVCVFEKTGFFENRKSD